MEKYTDFVYNVAFKMMGKPENVEDVVQEIFLSAYRAFDRFRGEPRMTIWFHRITVNSALMNLRKENRARTRTGLEDVDVVNWTDTPERPAASSELEEKLQERISQLPPDLRAVVVLRDGQELSNAEAYETLEITVSVVKSRLNRAWMLRKHLAGYLKAA